MEVKRYVVQVKTGWIPYTSCNGMANMARLSVCALVFCLVSVLFDLVSDFKHIEGFRPEWCISTIYHA